jgi:hypothetical protein
MHEQLSIYIAICTSSCLYISICTSSCLYISLVPSNVMVILDSCSCICTSSCLYISLVPSNVIMMLRRPHTLYIYIYIYIYICRRSCLFIYIACSKQRDAHASEASYAIYIYIYIHRRSCRYIYIACSKRLMLMGPGFCKSESSRKCSSATCSSNCQVLKYLLYWY